jgi:hypothetical protein
MRDVSDPARSKLLELVRIDFARTSAVVATTFRTPRPWPCLILIVANTPSACISPCFGRPRRRPSRFLKDGSVTKRVAMARQRRRAARTSRRLTTCVPRLFKPIAPSYSSAWATRHARTERCVIACCMPRYQRSQSIRWRLLRLRREKVTILSDADPPSRAGRCRSSYWRA